MAKTDATTLPEPLVRLPGSEKEVSILKARAVMARLAEEAADLREDEGSGAKTKRIEIARDLRLIQRRIDALDEEVEVVIPLDASKQFPFRIGPAEFYPGRYVVRGQVAQILRYMMDQHRTVESNRVVAGGNAVGDSLGRDLGAV